MFNDLVLLLEQYVSLIDPNITVYCGILREGYEALAMYCFGRYITACLGNFCLVTLLLCYLPQLALVLELHFV